MTGRLKSASMRNLTVTEQLTVGDGAVAYSSFKLNFEMLGSTLSARRERFSALYDTDPLKAWMVPAGLVVKGLTIEPKIATEGDNKKLHLENLKALPTSITADEADYPCGEIAFVVHRTKDDEAKGSCLPAGKYMTGAPDPNETPAWKPDGGTEYTIAPGIKPLYDSWGLYFQNFIVNLEGGCSDSLGLLGTEDPWNGLAYRRAIPSSRYTLQPGSPLTFVDASRTLFGQLPEEVNVPECSVYIDMARNALVSDGTWGIALGLVAQSAWNYEAGGTLWPQIKLSVTVHTEQIRR